MQIPVGTVVHLVSGSIPSLELPPVTPDHTTWARSKLPVDTEDTSATANEESPEISAAWLDNLFLDAAKARYLVEKSQKMTDSTVGMEQRDEHDDQCNRAETPGPGTDVGETPIAEAPPSSGNDEHLVINESEVHEEDIAGDQLLHCFYVCQEAGFRVNFFVFPDFLMRISSSTMIACQ